MKKNILFIAACCILHLSAFGQISEGGLPPSFKYPKMTRSTATDYKAVVDLNVEKLNMEDEIVDDDGGPLRVAKNISVNINIEKTGQWSVLPDSTEIWQQTLSADKALGLIISYKDFYIPEGGKLFIYNKDKSQILGAYTNTTNPAGGSFATEAVAGDSFTFEYVASKITKDKPRIEVESVGYMYRLSPSDVGAPNPVINTPHPESGRSSCRININCPAGANWQKQKRGVVMYYVMWGSAWYVCTGSLVNNTNQDGKPYVLTAAHCFSSNSSYEKLVVYFNYEFSGCENEDVLPANYKTLVGVTPKVKTPLSGGSDGFLFEINERVPNDWNPYYNGWDRQNIQANSGVVIHHPNKDVKKIITYINPVSHATYPGGATNAYWKVVYDGNSVSEKGSSGSPLFNEKGLIIGALTGGDSYCESPYNPDYYSKLWYSWDQYDKETEFGHKLQTFLDPMNTGALYLDAYDPVYAGIENEERNYTKDFVMFPVPVESELNINAASIIKKIKIYNILGGLVYTKNIGNSSTATVNMDGWSKGTYTISVETETKRFSDKVLKK